VGLIRH